jgi:hypothetical protein
MGDANSDNESPRSKKSADSKPTETQQQEDPDIRFSRKREVPAYKVRQAEIEERQLRRQEIEVAKESSRAARKSANWAVWAVVVGLAALAVGAWQQLVRN